MARATHVKDEVLDHWRTLPDGMNPLKHMEAIPYKASGSTYGSCGIRIDGNPQFIDAVLGRLKDLLDGENGVTRLGISRNAVQTKLEINGRSKTFLNTASHAEVCYVRLHQRGREAKMMNVVFGNAETDKKTERYMSL